MNLYKVELFLGEFDVVDGVFIAEIFEDSPELAVSKVKEFWKKETQTMYNIPRILKTNVQRFEIKSGIVWTFLEGI